MTRRGSPTIWLLPIAVVASACSGSSGRHAIPPPAPAVTTSIPSTTVTTVGGSASTTIQTSSAAQSTGPRTVLSPIGLNVRAQPAKTAAVLGTASQGAVLTVLAHSDQAGGWFQVKGATVTGWISDSSTLSAQGKFTAYMASTGQFGALYPATWTAAAPTPTSVEFRAPAGGESIVLTTAATVAALGALGAGYQASGSEKAVVCGVSTYMRTYAKAATAAAPLPDLAQVRVTLDAQHALGIDANLPDLTQLQTVRDFVNSVTFPFPQCQH